MKKIFTVILGFLTLLPLTSCGQSTTTFHTVTFDSDGGTAVSSQKIQHGEKIQKPDDPLKDGYIFDYWEYNNEKWSFSGHVVTEDMTLLAKYINSELDIPSEQTAYLDYEPNFSINATVSPTDQTISIRSLDESIVEVVGNTKIDDGIIKIDLLAKQVGETDVVVETKHKTTKTCHITVDKQYIGAELYDIVKAFYSEDKSVYLNKKVHFAATVCDYSGFNMYLQRYCESENKYYGIILYNSSSIRDKEFLERGALLDIYGTLAEYRNVCEIKDARFPFSGDRVYDCRVIKSASENTDPLTKLGILEYSASDFNSEYVSDYTQFMNLPIKINDELRIKSIEALSESNQSMYHFDNYDFYLCCTTIQDASVGDYLKINYSLLHPYHKSLISTFNVPGDVVLLT